ncbi:NAD(P)H-dependent oxidoreductase [Spirochaeta cellobiosiphila]|uniref:NAD(P)H-dependent oxidoreductase n=1 Tax=Spirochaeta cellobiosiphila TaxID=504483 RepID=UPI00041A5A2B|nr:NAD(P)H-dependent oxidoreductase [Spirochaeta cellobiosiphila]
MKSILVLNGSPRGEKSNTLILTKAFCKGLESSGLYRTEFLNIKDLQIKPCLGCFHCWTKSPGQCVIKDDMSFVLEKYIAADLVIWSFPLYYFGMPSPAKAVMDRLLPMNLPDIVSDPQVRATHPSRYDMSHQNTILISTCGFYSKDSNYDALLKQFERFRVDQSHPYTILCPEGELFSVPQLQGRTSEYLQSVTTAGQEYAHTGTVSLEVESKLNELLYPPEVFCEMANSHWVINEQREGAKALPFIKQMAAVYNPKSYYKDLKIRMDFTDVEESYAFHITRTGCEVIKAPNRADKADTIIETSFTLWKQISEGSIAGAQAMMDGGLKVRGEFDTMNHMDQMFGSESPHKDLHQEGCQSKKSPSMILLLLPWLALWIFTPIEGIALLGGILAIVLSSLITLLGHRFELTPYDRLTLSVAPLLGLISFYLEDKSILIVLSYIVFGLLWVGSLFSKVPLTAYYSSRSYGGSSAFSNPLFMKTNKIITSWWGYYYIVIGIVSYFLLATSIKPYLGLVTQIGPLVLGMLTIWFQKWYPGKVAH